MSVLNGIGGMFKRLLWLSAALVVGLIGVFLVRSAFERMQQMRMIERIPRVAVSDMIPGEANLSGRVELHQGNVLKGPDTGKACVYYHYTVERQTKDSDGDTKWETIENKWDFVPFLLADKTGSVLVHPEQAGTMTVSLASLHTRTAGNLRYNESRIDPGMTVFAMGLASRAGRNEGGGMNLQFKGEGAYVPILSVHGEEKERGTVGLYSLLLTGFGLLMLSLCMYGLTRTFGIHMAMVYLLLVTLTVSVTLMVQAIRMIRADLNNAFARVDNEQKVRAGEVRLRLEERDVRWDGDWQKLGELLDGTSRPTLGAQTAAMISRHRINLKRAVLRAERIRSGFPERLIAARMGLPPSVDFDLNGQESEQLKALEQEFIPSRISGLVVGIVGGLCGAVSLLLGALGLRRIRVKRWIENIPTVKTKGVVYGLNEVKGTVEMPEHEEPLSGPLSGQPCVCYRYTIKEKRTSGKKTEWVTIKDESRHKLFLCRDADGALPIDPEDAEVIMKARSRKREGRLSYEEYRLPVDGPVYALGCAIIDPERGDRLLMARSDDKSLPFLLSDRTEDELVARKAAVGLLLLTLGLNAFSLAGLFLAGWKGGFGVMQYQAAALAPLVYMVLFFFGVMYNDLVFLRRRCDSMWANIDVALKKRFDLLPAMANAAKAYLAHERSLMEALTQTRATGGGLLTPDEAGRLTDDTIGAVRQMAGLVEAYPELKANQTMQDLMGRIRDIEDGVALMREGYNHAVEIYNTRICKIPDVVLAKLFGFGERAFYEVKETA